MGQTLFAPPTVKGWDGGKAWLNSATLLARHNAAWRLVRAGGPTGVRLDPAGLAARHATGKDPAARVGFLLDLLLQPAAGELDPPAAELLAAFLDGPDPDRRTPEAVHAIACM